MISTLLYGSESWPTYSAQEKKLQAFHMRCLRRILGITWQDKVTNDTVLTTAGIPTMYTLLRQRRLRWLGHVYRMEDGRIPKDLLYGELASGKRNKGRPHLRFSDVCKRDMKACGIDANTWEGHAADRSKWKSLTRRCLAEGEQNIRTLLDEKRRSRKESQRRAHDDNVVPDDVPVFTCQGCSRVCRSRIGLYSHSRRCSSNTSTGANP